MPDAVMGMMKAAVATENRRCVRVKISAPPAMARQYSTDVLNAPASISQKNRSKRTRLRMFARRSMHAAMIIMMPAAVE